MHPPAPPAAPGAPRAPAPAAPPVLLRLLDRPQVIGPGGCAHALSANDAALLLLLAMRGALARDTLASLLWPEAGTTRARASLRQRAHRLARLAGGPVLEGGAVLALAKGVAHDLTDPADRLAADPWSLTAPPLSGLGFERQPELAEAVARERERWQDAVLQTLRRQTLALSQEPTQLGAALATARRWVAEEPTSEEAAQLQMRLHHRLGDRAAALTAFEQLKQRLAQHLGEPPGASTLALLHEIERGDVSDATPVPPLPLGLQHPLHTLGREALLAAVATRLTERRACLLVGPAGIGKTRVFDDLLQAHPRRVVCRLAAEDTDHPLASARRLAQAVRAAGDAGSTTDAGDAQALAWLAGQAGPAPAPGSMAPARLAGALRQALLASATPLLCAIDDLHFADPDSAALFVQLLDHTPGTAWLLTCRDAALPGPLRAWLQAQAAGDEAQFDLLPLGEDAVRGLLQPLLAAQADLPAWSGALQRHCGGHPLSLLQVLRALHARGDLVHRQPPQPLPVPREALLRVARRLDGCAARAQQLAYAAALAGADFSDAVARHVLGCNTSELTVPWRQLQTLGLMHDGGCSHELVRQAILGMLPAALAPALQRDIAHALRAAGAAPERRLAHWTAAQSWPELAADSQAAAADALAAGLRLLARQRLNEAAAAHTRAGNADAAFSARLQAVPLTLAVESAERAREEAQALLALAAGAQQRVQAQLALALVLADLHDEQALAVARQARDGARALGSPELQATAALREAVALYIVGRHTEALQVLRQDRKGTGPHGGVGSDWAEAEALTLAQLGRRREAATLFLRAWRQGRNGHDLARNAEHLGNAAIQLGYLGRSQGALRVADAAMAIDRRLGVERAHSAVNDLTVAGCCLDTGRYTRALEVGQRCVQALRESGFAHFTVSAENTLASTYLQLGRPDLALPLLADAPADAPAWARALRRAAQGGLARARGQPPGPAARDALQQLQAAGALAQPYLKWRVTLEATRCQAGPGTAIAEQALACADWADAHQHDALAVQARLVQIEGLLQAGQPAAAAAVADAVRARCRRGWPVYNTYLPELWWGLVQAWDAAGRTASADAMLHQARAWVLARAGRDMPELFRDSFLQRNRVNAALLARAARAAPALGALSNAASR